MNRSQAPRPRGQKDPARSHGSGNVRTDDLRNPQPAPGAERAGGGVVRTSLVSSVLGFVAAAAFAGTAAWASGCQGRPLPAPPPKATRRPSGPRPSPPRADVLRARGRVRRGAQGAPAAAPSEAPEPAAPDKPYTGPLLGSIVPQAAVYPAMEFSKQRLGYIRLGGKVPVDPKPIKGGSCAKGMVPPPRRRLRLREVGHDRPVEPAGPPRHHAAEPRRRPPVQVRLQHDARHAALPLRPVEGRDDALRAVPRVLEAQAEGRGEAARGGALRGDREGGRRGGRRSRRGRREPRAGGRGRGGSGLVEDKAAAVAEAASLGTRRRPSKRSREALVARTSTTRAGRATSRSPISTKDADGTVAKRMVKGFFVAVDKTFGWNGRSWYKTTAGLVAPSDRMYIIKPPASQGIDFPEGAKSVGFILAKSASKYQFDAEKKSVTVAGSLDRFAAFGLTGRVPYPQVDGLPEDHRGLVDEGRRRDVHRSRRPAAGSRAGREVDRREPLAQDACRGRGRQARLRGAHLAGEALEGQEEGPPHAHGVFRIREKHIATTMDGDGTVAGDLPYSIEDVPFVAYYDGSYALHGAFWHGNFGREMSHGCVNLSPLDAKKVFFWSEPRLPRGWHGVWATPENRGTLVSIHE